MYFTFSLSISFSLALFFEILYLICFTLLVFFGRHLHKSQKLIFMFCILISLEVCFATFHYFLLFFIFVNGLHYYLCMKTQELYCCDASWIFYVYPFVAFVLLGYTKLLLLSVSSWSLNYCKLFPTKINSYILNLWNNYKNYK